MCYCACGLHFPKATPLCPCIPTMYTQLPNHAARRSVPSSAVSRGYATFLSRIEWDYFSTLTFRNEPSIAAIRRAVERHLKRLGPQLAFWVLERGTVDSKEHVHVVYTLGTTKECRRSHKGIERDWYKRNGIAQVVDYEKSRGGCRYLCKTIGRSAPDYDIWTTRAQSMQQTATD